MRFDYLEAKDVHEAIELLCKYNGRAKVIAGGTDLLLQIRNKALTPEYILDIAGISGLDYIRYDENHGLRIGALTTIRTLETSPELQQSYPIISQAASQLGSVAIRNVATVGGNLCNAMPSAETAQALTALSANVLIIGPDKERIVSLEDFFTGVGSTVLEAGELMSEIQVPVLPPNTRGLYVKHSMRGTTELAIVNVAVVVTFEPERRPVCKDIKIVLGAVASTPMRPREAEEILRGKHMDDELINKAAQVASEEAHPRSGSIRGSVEYKKAMVKVLTAKLVRQAIASQ